MVPLSFAGHEFLAHRHAALFWPARSTLLVADLHLEKASWYGRHGRHLPPYDSHETLERLAVLVAETGAARVCCLGDNFHDDDGEARLPDCAAQRLRALTGGTEWIWITGNHDAALAARFGGVVVREWLLGGLALRHEAEPGASGPELSGHFHPKFRMQLRGRMVSRRCFVRTADKLILPAFGSLTGGLDWSHPAIRKALGPGQTGEALVIAGDRLVTLPAAHAVASSA